MNTVPNHPPFGTLDISFSNRCPLRCSHCMFAADLRYSGPTMPLAKVKSIIDEAAESPVFNLVAMGNQEFYLDYETFLEAISYSYTRYGFPLTVTTSCYWAKSEELALSIFSQLAEYGLVAVLLSVDRYHDEFVPFYRVLNSVKALATLGIHITVQCIRGAGHETIEEIRSRFGTLALARDIQFVEHNTTPVGRAEVISADELSFLPGPGVPSGNCNIFEVCHIEPDGSVKPCCGPGLVAEGLTVGNIHSESLLSIIGRANVDPLFNSLRANSGPKHLYQVLEQVGTADISKKVYSSTCHACSEIFTKPYIVEKLRAALLSESVELLYKRWMNFDRFLLHPADSQLTGRQSVAT